jgi:hypothetical protein
MANERDEVYKHCLQNGLHKTVRCVNKGCVGSQWQEDLKIPDKVNIGDL